MHISSNCTIKAKSDTARFFFLELQEIQPIKSYDQKWSVLQIQHELFTKFNVEIEQQNMYQ